MREYLASKELVFTSRGFYKILNLYKDPKTLQRGPENIDIYGLFLSDLAASHEYNHGNEIHFPLLLPSRSEAMILYDRINHEFGVNKFEKMFNNLLALETDPNNACE